MWSKVAYEATETSKDKDKDKVKDKNYETSKEIGLESPPPLPLLKVKVKSKNTQEETVELQALVDTGADVSIIRGDKVKTLKAEVMPTEIKLQGASAQVPIEGQVRLNVNVPCGGNGEDIKTDMDFVVGNVSNFDMVLGCDFLTRHKTMVDVSSARLFKTESSSEQDQGQGAARTIMAVQQVDDLDKLAEAIKGDTKEGDILQIEPEVSGFAADFREAFGDPIQTPSNDAFRKAARDDDKLYELLLQFKDVFSYSGHNPGTSTCGVHHYIDTGDAAPRRSRAYIVNPSEADFVRTRLDELEQDGIIRKSSSPWAAPAFFKVKPDGDRRLLIDYRKLNEVTIKDSYPMPNIDKLLGRLHGARYFTSLDFKSGYWQVPVAPQDIPKTAFITQFGTYECPVMPQGLSNAPATFQRLMDELFRDTPRTMVYIDDILIYGASQDEVFETTQEVMNILRKSKLHLRLDKCKFIQDSVKFLGHIIDASGVHASQDGIKAVLDFPTPKTIKDIQAFMGMAGFYRKFIKDFAYTAEPITKLIKRDGKDFVWDHAANEAFIRLKNCLTKPPVLAYPDFGKRFELTTDASTIGIGAVLEQDGHPIGFASRLLTPTERKYSTTDRECLALVWGIGKFDYYLAAAPFTVYFDHKALKAILTGPDPHGRHARIASKVLSYRFDMVHKPGKSIPHADSLSRYPTAAVNTINVDNDIQAQVKREQQLDTFSKAVISGLQDSSNATPDIIAVKDQYTLSTSGLLYHIDRSRRGDTIEQLYVPASLRTTICKSIHDDTLAGHLGFKKSFDTLRLHYYWPTMHKDLESYIETCPDCQMRKTPRLPKPGRMIPIVENRPFGTLAMDFLGPLPTTTRGNTYVLVFTDLFTKWVEAFATPKADAQTVAALLVDEIICRHGAPARLLSDRGTHFTNAIVKAVAEQFMINRAFTTPYHPQTDGQTERFNATLEDMLAIYTSKHQRDWDVHLPKVLFAYRTSLHASTRETPFYLMHGRDPMRPLDAALRENLPGEKYTDVDEYKQEITDTLRNARKAAIVALDKARMQMHLNYDNRHRESTFKTGDQVWLYAPHVQKGLSKKLSKPWQGPFRIINMPSLLTAELELSGQRMHQFVHVARLKHAYLREPPTDQVELDPGDNFDYELEDIRAFAEPVISHIEIDTAPQEQDTSETSPIDVTPDATSSTATPQPETFQVDAIIGRKGNKYLVKWADFPESESTWEPSSNIPKHLRDDFNASQPKRPRGRPRKSREDASSEERGAM